MNAPGFDLLAAIGFPKAEIEAANEYVCGSMTLEGAPGLKPEHLPVFDCASPCGKRGKRSLSGRAISACWRRPSPSSPARSPRLSTCRTRRRSRSARGLHAVVEARPQSERALSRRLQAFAAAFRPASRGGRCRRKEPPSFRRGYAGAARTIVAERIVERIIERVRRLRAREATEPPQRLHPKSDRRRPQGLSAHRRVRGRPPRRNLHRHAQGRRGLPER